MAAVLPALLSNLAARPSAIASAMETPPALETRIITGRENLLEWKQLLVGLSARCGLHGAMDHLEYFLSFKEARRKHPCLVLIGHDLASGISAQASVQTVCGAALVYEYAVLGYGTKIFATDDVSGRRTVLAPADQRARYARLAAEALMKAGAHAVVLSFIDHAPAVQAVQTAAPFDARKDRNTWITGTRLRVIRSFLPLERTFDRTLARIGQRTRSNLRYYRRRAEAQLGCIFLPDPPINSADFHSFNRLCSFAVPDSLADWRFQSLRKHPGMFLMGMKDHDGAWLSLVGGRRYDDAIEIDWQMNRSGLPKFSLSAVMRSYLIEHEVHRGTKRLFIEGGTQQPIRFSFSTHPVRDLLVLRNSRRMGLIRRTDRLVSRIVKRFVPKSNLALQLLTGKHPLRWQSWD